MAKYKAYPEYKDSGVEFLGLVPNEWSVKSLKNIVIIFNGSTPKSGVEEYWDGDINWITPTDLSQKSGVYLNDSQRKITNKGLDSCGTSLVPKNTVILSTRAPIGSLAITGTQSCTNQGCKSLVVKNKESSLFLYYYLSISTSPLNNLGRGSTFLELATEDLASFKVPMPNEGIGTIVSFLDHETAKIDNLIEKQQQLIELLKEKRQAVISRAVTKGLNPDVPMKDSDVEWLGEVPEHWDVKKFKFACVGIIAGPFGSSITKDMYVNDGYKVYGQEQVIPNDFNVGDYFISPEDFNKLSRYEVNAGDILISCVGTFGKIAVFPDWARAGIINPRLIKATLSCRMNPFFVREFLKSTTVSKQFELLSRGGTMGVINISILNEIMVSVPPLEEQDSIYEFIYSQKKKFIGLIDLANSQINLLQERRTALISAAVTGKIDVRDWVAPDTQDVEESEEASA